MQKTAVRYHNLGYWILLYIPLAAIGFYVTYFSVLFQPKAAIVHLHFGLVVLWMAMLISQPFLIKFKKLSLHRQLGKVSYVLVPLVLISGFAMLRYGYVTVVTSLSNQLENGVPKYSRQEILQEGAIYISIAFFYIFWFALFYVLAIINRKRSAAHARYMVATALTLTGPIVDRILFIPLETTHVFGILPAEAVSFLLIDLILIYLLWRDHRSGRKIKPLLTCLFIYLAGQLLFFTFPGSDSWRSFASFIMQYSW